MSGSYPSVSSVPPVPRLPDALEALRDRVAAAPLRLATAGRDAAVRQARAVVDQIDEGPGGRVR